jgi:hypothetical protein
MERGKMLPSVPTLFRLCVALRSGPHELMGFVPVASLPQAAQFEVPPELAHSPEMRRLLRLMGRLQGLQLKLILRLVMAFIAEPKSTRRQRKDRRCPRPRSETRRRCSDQLEEPPELAQFPWRGQ